MKVCLYGSYPADRRISMQVYANSLAENLRKSGVEAWVNTPCNNAIAGYSKNKWSMRFSRYVAYPFALKEQDADIHHVIDHGYAHLLPQFKSFNTCITVHDLIPLLSWRGKIKAQDMAAGQAMSFRKPLLNLHSLKYLTRYKHIITISENTRKDLVAYLGLNQNRISVVPPIIDSYFGPVEKSSAAQFAEEHKIDKSVKWLMISGSQYYKNHIVCLEVLEKLNKASEVPIKLIRTGHPSTEFNNLAAKMGIGRSVQNLYIESHKDLPKLYANMDCLLFPSLYEGFGMPVAEALACGTPVVASNCGALPEIAPRLVPHIDPTNVEGLSKAVHDALFNADIKKKTLESGGNMILPYRSKQVLKKLRDAYSKCLI